MHESLEDSRGIRQTLWKTAGAFVRLFGRQQGHSSDSLEDSRGIRQTLWKTGGAFVRHPKFMTTLLPASSTETLLLTSACIWRSVSPAHACEGCMLRCGCSSSVQENANISPSRLTQRQHHSLDARVFGRQQGHSSVQTA